MVSNDTDKPRLLKGRYAVDFERALPSVETEGAAACLCTDTANPTEALYALIPKDGAAFREHVLTATLARAAPNLVCPIETGTIELDGTWVNATILPYPTGGPLARPGALRPVGEGELRNRILPDIVAALRTLKALDLAHRHIRPDRIFHLDDSHAAYALGECFSEQPGASQPAVFEPVERALAHPAGRGEGDSQDDMFALGVTILTLLKGEIPCAGMAADDLMTARIVKGSYLTYVEGAPPRGSFGALLRGLLCDEPQQRWSLEQVSRWLDGVMPVEPVSLQAHAVSGNYQFQGVDYNNRRLLARALHANVEAAVSELHVPAFQKWLRTAVKEESGGAALDRLYGPATSRPGDGAAQRMNAGTLGKVIQILDPQGPMRFRALSVMADGLEGFLAHVVTTQNTVFMKDFEEWCRRAALRETSVIAAGSVLRLRRIVADFSEVERQVDEKSLGNGLERAVYDLNPRLMCQSPLLKGFHVGGIGQLLAALEALAAKDPERDILLDRHIVAFCVSRWPDFAGVAADLARNDRRYPERVVSLLRLYAMAQDICSAPPLPGLTRHFAAKLRPAVNALRHAKTRDMMLARLDRLAREGQLLKFHDELNFLQVRQQDSSSFSAARQSLTRIDRQITAMQRHFRPTDAPARLLGRRIAITGAYITAVASAYITLLRGI